MAMGDGTSISTIHFLHLHHIHIHRHHNINIMRFPNKDLYSLLRISRTATQQEIKQSYLQIALTLHPDRHSPTAAAATTAASAAGASARTDDNNNEMKTEEFKKVSEAYGILRDRTLRSQYDQWLDSGSGIGDSNKSRAAARNPFYRKVYSPAAPPGMKTFDRQRHYGEWIIVNLSVCVCVCVWLVVVGHPYYLVDTLPIWIIALTKHLFISTISHSLCALSRHALWRWNDERGHRTSTKTCSGCILSPSGVVLLFFFSS